MNTKTIASVIIVVLFAAAICIAEQNRGSAKITIDGGGFRNVIFPHHAHQKVIEECNTCHSLFPQSPHAIADLKTSGKLEKKQVMNKCRKCHREMEKAGEKTGPIKCSGCHGK